MRHTALMCVVLPAVVVLSQSLAETQGRGAETQAPPPSPQAAAPIDLTGYWVAIVTEDWRWRMVTPPKGDYASVPLNDAGRKVADTWDISKDGRCEAYGAGALLRMPTRLRITWESSSILRIDTDAGQQTRRLLFDKSRRPPTAHSLQGYSLADWERPARAGGGGGGGRGGGPQTGPAPGANLKVLTTRLTGGWLRKNGVPYSEEAVITEYFDRFDLPGGEALMVVSTEVVDPTYLAQPFWTSTHFKKQRDATGWKPTPCTAR